MAHNGGRSQLGLWSLGIGADFPFINLLKEAQLLASTGGYGFPAVLNANNYPTSNPGTQINSAFFLPTTYTGAYILDWEGTGQINIGPAAGDGMTVTEGASYILGDTLHSLTTQGANGRIKFTFTTQQTQPAFYFQGGSVGFGNVRFYRADHESRLLAGEVFNPDFVTKLRALNCGAHRFMDWVISHNQTKWAHRGTVNDFSYAAPKWLPNSWGGTVSGTDTYTATAATDTPGSWTHGEIWQGQFTNANTSATPTINIGARGAKTMVGPYGAALAAGDIAANAVATLVYQSDLDKVLYVANGLIAGVPQEHLITLCNLVNSHGWTCIPTLADDDYVTQAATLWSASLGTGLRAKFEYSNEIWNFSQYGTHLAQYKGNIGLGIPTADLRAVHGWYAKRYAQMYDLVAAVFGTSSDRFRCELASQSAGDLNQIDTYRLQGQDVLSAPNRPIDKLNTELAKATYYKGANVFEFQADYTDKGSISAAAQAAADSLDTAWLDNDIRAGAGGSFTLAAFENTTDPAWHAKAVTYGKKLVEYEGALALTAPTAATCTTLSVNTAYATKFANLIAAYKNSAYAKQITLDRYNHWVARSNGAEPSQYLLAGNLTWALDTPSIYNTAYKMYDGVAVFNTVSSGLIDKHDGEEIWHQKTYFEPSVLRSALDILPAEAIAELETIAEPQRTDSVYVPLEHRINVDELMERVELAYQVREAVRAADEEDVEMLLLGTP